MHAVELEEVSLSEQINFILTRLETDPKLRFSSLIERFQSRLVIVVTFLAILEMLRAQQIKVRQTKLFDDLIISRGSVIGQA